VLTHLKSDVPQTSVPCQWLKWYHLMSITEDTMLGTFSDEVPRTTMLGTFESRSHNLGNFLSDDITILGTFCQMMSQYWELFVI
jgi:hypothetical protein